jgi:hypothetical protein
MLGTSGKQNPEITGMKYQKIIQQKTKSGYFPIQELSIVHAISECAVDVNLTNYFSRRRGVSLRQ